MAESEVPSTILSLLSEDSLIIGYRPALARLVGSVTGAILLQQMVHRWFAHGRKAFYKFKQPCQHKDYRPGDSWCEELAFTRREFDTALGAIGTKVTKGVSKTDLMAYVWPDLPEESTSAAYGTAWQEMVRHLVIYWTDSSRVTWYWLNETLLEKAIVESLSGKGGKRLYLESTKTPLPSNGGKRLYPEKAESAFTSSKDSESGDSALDPQSPAQTPSQTNPQSPSSTTSGPIAAAPDSTANSPAVVVDDGQFILPEIQKLGLTPKAQGELLALGPLKALAIAFAALKPGVRNPGGLAISMMTDGGPSELDLALAGAALELRILDRAAIDEQLRKREYARIAEQMNDLLAQKTDHADQPGAQVSTDPEQSLPSSSVPDPPADDTGLSYRPGNGRLTIRDLWLAAQRSLNLQLNRSTFDNWVKGTKALGYADGVLTVQAKHLMARDMLVKNDWLGDAITRLAGKPIQVRVVLAGEEVGR